MNKKAWITPCILLITIFTIPISGFESTELSMINCIPNNAPSSNSPIADKVETCYIPNLSCRKLAAYYTINELKAFTPSVFTGTCISSKPVFQNDMLYTISTVKIMQVIKGTFAAGSTISIVEMCGRTTVGEYAKNCNVEVKAFKTSAESLPDDSKIVSSMDGHFAMKEGENVLLFVSDASGFIKGLTDPLYSIIGDYDGKFLLQEDGSYARPVPSKTDKLVFADMSGITINELISMK